MSEQLSFKEIRAAKKNKSKEARAETRLNTQETVENSGGYVPDERFWKMKKEKVDGNWQGRAKVRFLDQTDIEIEYIDVAGNKTKCLTPYIKYKTYNLNREVGKKKHWYYERTPVIGEKRCPLSAYNGNLYNKEQEGNPVQLPAGIKRYTQTLKVVRNILVIDDPMNPDNNGKVFLFEFGNQIEKQILAALKPKFSSTKAIDVVDEDFGANAEIQFSVDGDNEFGAYNVIFEEAALCDGDEAKMEEVFNGMYPLGPELAQEKYITWDDSVKKAKLFYGYDISVGSTDSKKKSPVLNSKEEKEDVVPSASDAFEDELANDIKEDAFDVKEETIDSTDVDDIDASFKEDEPSDVDVDDDDEFDFK